MATIDVQAAVKEAKKTLLALYSDDLPQELALEEIELVTEDSRELWSVTLGFHRKRSLSAPSGQVGSAFGLAAAFHPPRPVENRVYKTIYIDANTGMFVKMDMRQV